MAGREAARVETLEDAMEVFKRYRIEVEDISDVKYLVRSEYDNYVERYYSDEALVRFAKALNMEGFEAEV